MNDCIFCKIIEKEIPSDVIFEDADLIVIKDIHPSSPIHYLFIPKKHFKNLVEMDDGDAYIVGKIAQKARDIAKKEGFDQTGFRFIANNGHAAGQEVDHIHFHVMAGRQLGLMG